MRQWYMKSVRMVADGMEKAGDSEIVLKEPESSAREAARSIKGRGTSETVSRKDVFERAGGGERGRRKCESKRVQEEEAEGAGGSVSQRGKRKYERGQR